MPNTTVWKYARFVEEIAGEWDFSAPRGAEFLPIVLVEPPARPDANPAVALYARVDPLAERVEHLILIAGTGHSRTDTPEAPYLGAAPFLLNGVRLVFHFFDGGER